MKKTFDCLEYKRQIQDKHFHKNVGLTDEERVQKRRDWLESSDDPMANLWRSLAEKHLQRTLV